METRSSDFAWQGKGKGQSNGAWRRGTGTRLVLAGVVDDLLLGLAHNIQDQGLALLCPICSNA